jgi:hypothetical protein
MSPARNVSVPQPEVLPGGSVVGTPAEGSLQRPAILELSHPDELRDLAL